MTKPRSQLVDGVAWQKSIRDSFLHEGAPDVDLSLKSAIVRPVSRRVARQIILKYEWLGTMASTSLHYGVFFDIRCAGVTCVGINGSGTAGPWVHRQYGIERCELVTLARGACVHWAPTGTNSKLVSWTCRLVTRDIKTARLIVAYADPEAGEIGTIYQASGWHYIGVSKRGGKDGMYEIVSPEGRVLNSQTVGAWARKNRMGFRKYLDILLGRGWEGREPSGKGIYAKVLNKRDKTLRKLIEARSLPYPKRCATEAKGAHSAPTEKRRFESDPVA